MNKNFGFEEFVNTIFLICIILLTFTISLSSFLYLSELGISESILLILSFASVIVMIFTSVKGSYYIIKKTEEKDKTCLTELEFKHN